MIARLTSQFSASAISRASGTALLEPAVSGASGSPLVLLVASGRGGSGTTLASTLLAVSAAGEGTRVLLVDGDDLVGPIALLLGVLPAAGWTDLRGGGASPADVVTPVSTTLTLVAGGAPRRGAGDTLAMNPAERRACMRRLTSLYGAVDLVVIDCGSRLDTVLAALGTDGRERLVAVTAGTDPIALAATFALCKAVTAGATARHGALPLDLLVNRHEATEAARCFDVVDAGVRQFLGSSLRFAGALPSDPTLDAALRRGMPFLDAAAGSPAAFAAHDAVTRALAGASPTRPGV